MAETVSPRARWSLWSIVIASTALAGIAGARRPVNDNSFLWHVRAGDLQRSLGHVLTQDPFTFTGLGRPWRTQSWLMELLYSYLDGHIGLKQVPWIISVGWVLLTIGVLVLARRVLRHPFQVALFMVASSVVLIGFSNPRPVVASFPLMVLVVLAGEDRRLRWTAPLVIWVWAACHGSFVVGGAYLALLAWRRKDSGLFKVAVASGVASLLTAHGWGVVSILLDFSRSSEALDHIQEWAPPDLLSIPFLPLAAALFLLMAAGIKGKIVLRDLLVIVPFLLLAFQANRTVPPAWIALIPLVAAGFGVLPAPKVSRGFAPVFVTGLTVVLLAGILLVPAKGGLDEKLFPVDAAEHVTGQRLFADDAAGGYLVYRYFPDRLIYVDDRAEVLSDVLLEMVEARGGNPSWHDTFAKWDFDEALLKTKDPLVELLSLSGWSEAYRDDNWVLLRPSSV